MSVFMVKRASAKGKWIRSQVQNMPKWDPDPEKSKAYSTRGKSHGMYTVSYWRT